MSERGGSDLSPGLKQGVIEMVGSPLERPSLQMGKLKTGRERKLLGVGGRAGPHIQIACLQ